MQYLVIKSRRFINLGNDFPYIAGVIFKKLLLLAKKVRTEKKNG